MSISALTRVYYAYHAGFRNTNTIEALAIVVAISLTECPIGAYCETNCIGGNEGGGGICGLMQIDQNYAGGPQASDPQGAFNLAYQISHQGTNFTPWYAWNNGSFRNNLAAARTAVTQYLTPTTGPPAPGTGTTGGPTPVPPVVTSPPPPAPSTSVSPLAAVALLAGGAVAVWELNRRAHRAHQAS